MMTPSLRSWAGAMAVAAGLAATAILGRAGDAAAQAEPLLTLVDARPGAAAEVVLTGREVDAIPAYVIRTRTDFTDGVTEFAGPRVTDLLARVDLAGTTTARLVAANDYSVEIPLSDFERYGVILATRANGKALSPRGKGPYWVMYPLDQFRELQDPIYNNRLIWQVIRIELR